ncbi:uncharacterized protein LOC101848481 [Aplysia californica]|uniref:Uncharacterized protein LOC101848481 n=1 Tax=Aplysia californica TaxID=6500 RepID=A0ABM0JBC4_APLCA|nr:uncharacterized protein LOC101848481 [Aplysia californica]
MAEAANSEPVTAPDAGPNEERIEEAPEVIEEWTSAGVAEFEKSKVVKRLASVYTGLRDCNAVSRKLAPHFEEQTKSVYKQIAKTGFGKIADDSLGCVGAAIVKAENKVEEIRKGDQSWPVAVFWISFHLFFRFSPPFLVTRWSVQLCLIVSQVILALLKDLVRIPIKKKLVAATEKLVKPANPSTAGKEVEKVAESQNETASRNETASQSKGIFYRFFDFVASTVFDIIEYFLQMAYSIFYLVDVFFLIPYMTYQVLFLAWVNEVLHQLAGLDSSPTEEEKKKKTSLLKKLTSRNTISTPFGTSLFACKPVEKERDRPIRISQHSWLADKALEFGIISLEKFNTLVRIARMFGLKRPGSPLKTMSKTFKRKLGARVAVLTENLRPDPSVEKDSDSSTSESSDSDDADTIQHKSDMEGESQEMPLSDHCDDVTGTAVNSGKVSAKEPVEDDDRYFSETAEYIGLGTRGPDEHRTESEDSSDFDKTANKSPFGSPNCKCPFDVTGGLVVYRAHEESCVLEKVKSLARTTKSIVHDTLYGPQQTRPVAVEESEDVFWQTQSDTLSGGERNQAGSDHRDNFLFMGYGGGILGKVVKAKAHSVQEDDNVDLDTLNVDHVTYVQDGVEYKSTGTDVVSLHNDDHSDKEKASLKTEWLAHYIAEAEQHEKVSQNVLECAGEDEKEHGFEKDTLTNTNIDFAVGESHASGSTSVVCVENQICDPSLHKNKLDHPETAHSGLNSNDQNFALVENVNDTAVSPTPLPEDEVPAPEETPVCCPFLDSEKHSVGCQDDLEGEKSVVGESLVGSQDSLKEEPTQEELKICQGSLGTENISGYQNEVGEEKRIECEDNVRLESQECEDFIEPSGNRNVDNFENALAISKTEDDGTFSDSVDVPDHLTTPRLKDPGYQDPTKHSSDVDTGKASFSPLANRQTTKNTNL